MFKFFQCFNRRTSTRPPHYLVDTFLNAEATVADSIPPQGKGKVRIFGSYWPAVAETIKRFEIPVGTRVIVQRREGLALVVTPLTTHNPQVTETRFIQLHTRLDSAA